MSFTVTLSWWMLPTAIMLIGGIWAIYPRSSEKRRNDYDFLYWIPWATRLTAVVITTLVSWLMWALLR